MAGKLQGYLRACAWWRLLLVATASGIVVGILSAILGIFCTIPLGQLLAQGQETTEAGDAVLAMYAFMTFGATGSIVGFSGTYGIARQRGSLALAVTCIVLGVNIVGFFVPTGGYTLLPFYSSIVLGLTLTVVLLILRPARGER
jgi:hypothetical protein